MTWPARFGSTSDCTGKTASNDADFEPVPQDSNGAVESHVYAATCRQHLRADLTVFKDGVGYDSAKFVADVKGRVGIN